ncbi:MAG: hypothetical protein R6V35_02225 [Candidatus Nanohaloarchaea archaeon]
MSDIVDVLQGLVGNVVAFAVMILLAIVTFFVTVFVVVQGAALAGIEQPSADFVVLSATILVASTILAGIMNN